MGYTAVTNSFTNGTTASASEVNQNFTDIINGLSDGTKDLSIAAITAAGTATFNGAITLGNATTDDLTITGSLASSIPIKTTASYNIGSNTLGLLSVYFGRNAKTTRLIGHASMAADYTITLPDNVPAAANYALLADTSGNTSWKYPQAIAYVGTDPEVGGSTPFTLTTSHNRHQIINPAGAITIKLPTTGVLAGESWTIVNQSTNVVTVQSSGANTIQKINNDTLVVVALQNTPTAATHWRVTSTPKICDVDVSGIAISNQTESSAVYSGTRIGNKLEVNGFYVPTALGTSEFAIDLPTGITIDSTKYTTSTQEVGLLTSTYTAASKLFSTSERAMILYHDSTSDVKIYAASGQEAGAYIKMNGNDFGEANKGVAFHFSIYVSEWALT